MAKRSPKLVEPSNHPKERNVDYPLYINRFVPYWGSPGWEQSDRWRTIVNSQPIALVCRDTLIALVNGLDWVIEPRDSNQRDELKSEIDYYTKFFEYTGDYDYSTIIEWVSKDLLDLPFGSGVELGRKYDAPDGRIMWIELLDGSTLFPTNNHEYPVAQYVPQASPTPIYFPAHAINRVYMSPRTRIRERGWGMAPPEKIYLALELINRGDYYYANLLLDTPAAGILDLGDMDQESAKEWVVAWRQLLNGIDPYKVPVLYEHEKPVSFIPFAKNPTDLHFNVAMMRYAGILLAGYGMSMSDIGLSMSSNGGETLAGTIRDERRTRRTGVSSLKKKLVLFFNRMLPDTLQFRFIDLDDELMVSLGRARLAVATSLGALVDKRMITPEEGRMQMLADGLITISIPEALPKELKVDPNAANNNQQNSPERPNMLGRPVSPGQGGWGEVAARSFGESVKSIDMLRAINTVFPSLNVLSGFEDDDLVENELLQSVSDKLVSEYKSLTENVLAKSEYKSILMSSILSRAEEVISEEVKRLYVLGEIDTLDFDVSLAVDKELLDINIDGLLKSSVDTFCKELVADTLSVTMDEFRQSKSSTVDVFSVPLQPNSAINRTIQYINSKIDDIISQSLRKD